MGYKDIRGTAPLEKLSKDTENRVGVVSLSRGGGATFICSLLRRESTSANKKIDLIDLGEDRETSIINTMLVVADCTAEVSDNFPKMINHLKKREVKFGLVLNKYNEENINEALAAFCEGLDSKIPVFRVPVIETERFTDLYNYVFYN